VTHEAAARGRRATSAARTGHAGLHARDYLAIGKRALRKASDDHVTNFAAALAY
jgi:hypothetical protein